MTSSKLASVTVQRYKFYHHHSKIKFVSPSGHVMFTIIIETDEIVVMIEKIFLSSYLKISSFLNRGIDMYIITIIIYKKKYLDCDWLIPVQLIPNNSAKLCYHRAKICNRSAKICNQSVTTFSDWLIHNRKPNEMLMQILEDNFSLTRKYNMAAKTQSCRRTFTEGILL